jgi:hypothetical protein
MIDILFAITPEEVLEVIEFCFSYDNSCLFRSGGVLCRLWHAVSQHRRQAQESSATAD